MTTATAAIRMAKKSNIRRTIRVPRLLGCASAHILVGEPVSIPDQVRDRLSPGYALGARRNAGALPRAAAARLGPGLGAGRKALVEIGADRDHQRLDLAVEEMVGALHDLLLDHDALLGLELLDEAGHVLLRHHRILVAMDDQAGGRAGGEKREVVEVRGRRDRDEAFDLGPPHQELHADPGAEREAGDPAAPRLRIDRLRPVEGGGGIRQLAGAMVERALAAADAAEVEAQHREIAMRERIVELINDLVVHRAAELRVRVQDDRDRRVLLLGRMEAAFDPSGGSGENDFGPRGLDRRGGGGTPRRPGPWLVAPVAVSAWNYSNIAEASGPGGASQCARAAAFYHDWRGQK